MAENNPGAPLNPSQLAGAQGLPMDTILVQSHIMNVGNGQYSMCIPALLPVPIQHAEYKFSDVPCMPFRADYKP